MKQRDLKNPSCRESADLWQEMDSVPLSNGSAFFDMVNVSESPTAGQPYGGYQMITPEFHKRVWGSPLFK
jgi:hypothetical protein